MTYPCIVCHKLCSPIDSFVTPEGARHRACEPPRRNQPVAVNISYSQPPPRVVFVPVADPRMRA